MWSILFVSYAYLLRIKVVPVMWLHYVSCSPPFIKTLISFSYKCFYKLHLWQNFPYIRQNVFTFPNYWVIHRPMFNHHSIIPWGSFRGWQEEKWGSFWGQDHFGVGIILRVVQVTLIYSCHWRWVRKSICCQWILQDSWWHCSPVCIPNHVTILAEQSR